MKKIVGEGVSIKGDTLNFDGGRWFAFPLISDTHYALDHPFIEGNNTTAKFLKKQIFLDDISGQHIVKWYGFWKDTNKNGQFDGNTTILLFVNNHSFDVTNKYFSLKPWVISEFELKIPNDILFNGKNELILRAYSQEENTDDIIIVTQNVYVEANSFITTNTGKNWDLVQEEFLWYVVSNNGLFYSIIFKLGFILRILGILLLFIAVFGLNFSRFIIKKYYLQLSFSTFFAYFVYWFSEFIKSKWYFFSQVVAKSLFFMFKISNLKTFVNFSGEVPMLGIQGFVVGIYDVCSGVDSMGLFTLAYFILIVLHWNKIIFWKSLLIYLLGLIGIFLLNIVRVYLLIIIGSKISTNFALNAFHTNAGMVFAVIYFIIFLPFAMKFMKK